MGGEVWIRKGGGWDKGGVGTWGRVGKNEEGKARIGREDRREE